MAHPSPPATPPTTVKCSLECFGPHPNVVRSSAQDDIKRLCFGTTQRNAYSFPRLRQEHRAESMQDIFEMGKKTKSKYLAYQMKVAPNLHKNACIYSKEFANK